MKVSIIIPVYNVEKYLKKCLDSAVNQTWRDIEVIVIDDASPDNCKSIIKQYEEQYPDILKAIYLEQNLCQGGARNKGLEIATGEYITYLDSDDFLDETMCERMILEAQRTDVDIVYCDAYRNMVGQNQKFWVSYQFTEEMGDMTEQRYWLHLLNYGYVWGKLIRTQLLKENHIVFPEHKKYEDFAFMPLVILYSRRTAYVKAPLYYYSVREQSVMTTQNAEHHKDMVYMGDFVCEEMNKRGFYAYANLLKAIAYYKAAKLIMDKYDEPDTEYIWKLSERLKEFYHPDRKQLYMTHDPIEVQIIETAQNSKNELFRKTNKQYETDIEYESFYNTFKDEICAIFNQYAGKRIAIWGYGKKGKALLKVIHSCPIRLQYIIDKNKEIQDSILETGETIKAYQDIYDKVDVIIIVNRNYFSAIEAEIKSQNSRTEVCNLEAWFMNCASEGSSGDRK